MSAYGTTKSIELGASPPNPHQGACAPWTPHDEKSKSPSQEKNGQGNGKPQRHPANSRQRANSEEQERFLGRHGNSQGNGKPQRHPANSRQRANSEEQERLIGLSEPPRLATGPEGVCIGCERAVWVGGTFRLFPTRPNAFMRRRKRIPFQGG